MSPTRLRMAHVLEEVAATVPEATMDAMDVRHTTTESARRRRLLWHKQTTVGPRASPKGSTQPARARTRMRKTAPGPAKRRRPMSPWPVRIVVRQLRHCGDATTTDTQSAMPAVCFAIISYLILISSDFNLSGLYYKLHGVHRPSGMKKSEIKRRRRVMPATSDQHLAPFSVNNTQPISPPPEPVPVFQRSVPPFYPQPQQHQHQHTEHSHSHSHQIPPPPSFEPVRLPRAPIAVDFTHFGKPLRPTSAEQPELAQPSEPPVSRKRSFSISNASDQARQPLSPAYPRSDRSHRSEAENIDPSLSSVPTVPASMTSHQDFKAPLAMMGAGDLSQAAQSSRQEKRARLEQEMAMMRDALLAKEREMAELSD
jgi:hypothetical protein